MFTNVITNIYYKYFLQINILIIMITITIIIIIIIVIYYYFIIIIAKVKSIVPIDNLIQFTGSLPRMSFTLCSGTF